MTNIFEIIAKVTSRIEPFHSEFLTSALRENRKLLNDFLKLVFPSDTGNTINELMDSNSLEIISEDSFSDFKRIDILIKEPKSKYIIGIEVKTTDSSVRSNQLEEYNARLIEKYPGFQVLLVFLTPFNNKNLPKEISPKQNAAINEFDLFYKTHKNAVHLNWDEVVDLYENTQDFENSIFVEHRNYINTRITNPSRLITRISNVERNRELSEFFGADCVQLFFEELEEHNIKYYEDSQKINFNFADKYGSLDDLMDVLKVLIESEQLNIRSNKKNKVSEKLLEEYKSGANGKFFKKLFVLISSYKFLYLEGAGNIGVRAAHSSPEISNVSVFTIEMDKIVIRKNR